MSSAAGSAVMPHEDEDLDLDLADLPFDVLQKLQQKVGLKRFKAYLHGKEGGEAGHRSQRTQGDHDAQGAEHASHSDGDDGESAGGRRDQWRGTHKRSAGNEAQQGKKKKRVKGAPLEVSSRKKAPKVRKVISTTTQPLRDPRFDTLSGVYNEELWSKSYGFIADKQSEEAAEIKKELRKTKDPERRDELTRLLQSLKNRIAHRKTHDLKKKAKSERTRAERELVAKGKKPFYLKSSDAMGLQALEEFESLRKSGAMTKKLVSKRKRDASKARRHLPE
eukprot:m.185461 g.185461  ORF g.185461 m.185461 type:complete len:278 (+) comp16457_c0_seq1:161-994(+)